MAGQLFSIVKKFQIKVKIVNCIILPNKVMFCLFVSYSAR